MGLEFQATLPAKSNMDTIRACVQRRLLAEGWQVVREQNHCVSFARGPRPPSHWDEDFMVCFDGSLYFVDHQATRITSQEIQTIIDDALGSLDLAVIWEEL